MRTFFLTICALVCASSANSATFDVTPPDGAELTAELNRTKDRYSLPISSFTGDKTPTAAIRGDVRWVAYKISDPALPFATVVDGFRQRLAREGFERLLDCEGTECGGFDFRFGASLMPPPQMRMDVANFAQLSMGRAEPSGYVSVLASRVGKAVYVQVVTVKPDARRVTLVGSPLVSEPTETVAQASEQRPVSSESAVGNNDAPDSATPVQNDNLPLLEKLMRDGHVAVGGLAFATGGAKLTAESDPALAEMADVLKANPELKVAIVGHSDNVGSLNGNIELSRRRAAAVRTALINLGVKKSRLEARGVGYLAPVRSNATPEGRALNRRVELVLR